MDLSDEGEFRPPSSHPVTAIPQSLAIIATGSSVSETPHSDPTVDAHISKFPLRQPLQSLYNLTLILIPTLIPHSSPYPYPILIPTPSPFTHTQPILPFPPVNHQPYKVIGRNKKSVSLPVLLPFPSRVSNVRINVKIVRTHRSSLAAPTSQIARCHHYPCQHILIPSPPLLSQLLSRRLESAVQHPSISSTSLGPKVETIHVLARNQRHAQLLKAHLIAFVTQCYRSIASRPSNHCLGKLYAQVAGSTSWRTPEAYHFLCRRGCENGRASGERNYGFMRVLVDP